MKIYSQKKGFTLVEMLVTTAVIGILASIVYANFGQSRAIARDNVRKADLKSLQLAINLYKAQNGRYPEACSGVWRFNGGGPDWAGPSPALGGDLKYCEDYIQGLVPDFIAVLPKDPKLNPLDSGSGYLYSANFSGTEYKLLAYDTVEVQKIKVPSDEFARCPLIDVTPFIDPVCDYNGSWDATYWKNSEYSTYAVYSPGAKDW